MYRTCISQIRRIWYTLSYRVILFWLLLGGGYSHAQNIPQDIGFYYGDGWTEGASTDLGHLIKEESINNSDSLLNQLIELFWLTNPAYWTGTSRTIDYVKWIINLSLSLVSLIALILIIYGFYLMFFSKDEEWFAKAKKILKWVAIALTIMGLSRVIVSFFFGTQRMLAS